jgi:RimK family alpha-L-glutamate ligase
MTTFAVIAHRCSPTNSRLGAVLSPAQALARLGHGDVALGRLDVLPTLDGIEPGLWALDRLEARGVTVLNARRALVAAHDKLTTADRLFAVHVPHPRTVHVAPWLPDPELEPPLVLKPRFGSWGSDVVRCDDAEVVAAALDEIRGRPWFEATGAIAQKLVQPQGYDMRLVVAGGTVVGAVRRIAAPGEWRTNVALGARREPVDPPSDARAIAHAAAAAIGGDLVGVDLLPAGLGSWVVLEVNGAVDFNGTYSLADDVYAETRRALMFRPASVRVEPAA